MKAVRWPWKSTDYPHLEAWLKANEKPLALAVEATKQPDYFHSIVSSRKTKNRHLMSGASSPAHSKYQEIANALTTRAMLRISNGKLDDAWQDLLACHRLGRLIGRGATLFEALLGFAIDTIANKATLAYLDRVPLSAKELQTCLKDLQNLPPLSPLAEKVDLTERLILLDMFQLVRRGDPVIGEFFFDVSDPEAKKALEKIDWATTLRRTNKWFDRTAAVLRLKDRAEREKELAQIAADFDAMKKEAPPDAPKAWLSERRPEEIAQAVADIVISPFNLPAAAHKMQRSFDRCEQIQRNLEIAFALAAYRSDAGRYPDKLNDLAPKYLATVPDDIFAGKPLIYRITDKGHLLYSVGLNGKDDEGRSEADDPPGDDIAVRMPLAEPKQKK
jgi:hypothetical protein